MYTVLECKHLPKHSKRTYRCTSTGNYVLELCDKCRGIESKQFMIEENVI